MSDELNSYLITPNSSLKEHHRLKERKFFMNTNILHEIYTINKQTPGEDLTISLAKFQAEHPGEVSHEEAKTLREFVGRHGKTLAVAYRKGKAAFQAVVEVLEAQDKEAQEAAQ